MGKIGIIGAGVCGLGLGKSLRQSGIEFEIIESTSNFGGNWQPEGSSSKMYESVHLISSKRNTQFTDYPMPKEYSDYPRHSFFFNYLKDLAAEFNLHECTRFNTTVVDMQKDRKGWLLHFQDGGEERYDFVVVCNGLLRKPFIPEYPGKFAREELHAKDYKSADFLRDKRVLVVGGGNSGCDIAVDAAHTAKAVFHSTRRGYHYMPKFIDGRPTQEWLMDQAPKFPDSDQYWAHVQKTFKLAGFDGQDYGLPEPDHAIQDCHPIMNSQILYHIGHGDILAKPDINHLVGDTVHFSDGSSEVIDLIVWATGYDIDLPFLSTSVYDWRTRMTSLFLDMVPQEFDNLLFVGYLNSPSGIGNLVNIMGRFVVAYIKAHDHGGSGWDTFQEMKMKPDLLDLGKDRFIKTRRHEFEVDLWKFIKSVNFMTGKLEESASVALNTTISQTSA